MQNLTPEQSEAFEKAAFLIISAQKEAREKARAILKEAGIPDDDDDPFGRPCSGHFDGHPCPCRDYEGDGGPCLNLVTLDVGATPVPEQSCGHPASKHLHT